MGEAILLREQMAGSEKIRRRVRRGGEKKESEVVGKVKRGNDGGQGADGKYRFRKV